MTVINTTITLTLAQRKPEGRQVPIIVFIANPSMIPCIQSQNGEYRPVRRIIEALRRIAATPRNVLKCARSTVFRSRGFLLMRSKIYRLTVPTASR
jgi:hypothetical protein